MEKIISQVLNSSIESCLFKEARDWDDLTLEEQRDYIKKHPKSKKRLTSHKQTPTMSRELRENIRRDPEKYPTEQLQAAIDLTDHAIEVMEEDPMSEGAPTDEIASSWKRKDRRIEIELENRERKEQQKPASSNLDALKKQLDKAKEEYEEEDADLQRGTSSELIEHDELKRLLDSAKEEYETEKGRGAYDKEDIELLRKRYEDLKQKYDDEEEDIKRGASPVYKKLEALKKKMDEAKKKYDNEFEILKKQVAKDKEKYGRLTFSDVDNLPESDPKRQAFDRAVAYEDEALTQAGPTTSTLKDEGSKAHFDRFIAGDR